MSKATDTFPRPWSHSRLEVARCRWRLWQLYVEGCPRIETAAMAEGKAVHIVLARAVGGNVDGRWSARDELAAYARTTLGGFPVPGLIGAEEKLAVDAHWRPCEFDSPDAMLRGVLDVLQIDDNLAVITDWKHTERIERAEGNAQLRLYATLAVACYPQVRDVMLRLANTKHLTRPSAFPLDDIDLAAARKSVERRIASAERLLPAEGETPQALACSACSWCECYFDCPLGEQLVQAVAHVTTPGEAEKAAQSLVLLDVAAKRLKAALNPWTAENGPARAGDVEFGHFTAKKPEPAYDTSQVRARLQGRELEPDAWRDGAYKIDGRALRKLAEREGIDDEIAQCETQPTKSTKFGKRKAEDHGEE